MPPVMPRTIVARILRARIVVGDDDLIGEFVGNGAHQRPLAGVAIAAAAEHAPQRAAAVFAQRRQRLGERVRRMRIVDHGQRLAAHLGLDDFHAAGRRGASAPAPKPRPRAARRAPAGSRAPPAHSRR